MEMPVHRFGLVTEDPLDVAARQLTTLPWADATTKVLERYRAEQPTAEELGRVDAYQSTPVEMLENPHLRVRALENELAHMFHNFLASLEQTLDEESARKVADAAGPAHGKWRTSTVSSTATRPSTPGSRTSTSCGVSGRTARRSLSPASGIYRRADQRSSQGIRAAAQGKEVEGCRYS